MLRHGRSVEGYREDFSEQATGLRSDSWRLAGDDHVMHVRFAEPGGEIRKSGPLVQLVDEAARYSPCRSAAAQQLVDISTAAPVGTLPRCPGTSLDEAELPGNSGPCCLVHGPSEPMPGSPCICGPGRGRSRPGLVGAGKKRADHHRVGADAMALQMVAEYLMRRRR